MVVLEAVQSLVDLLQPGLEFSAVILAECEMSFENGVDFIQVSHSSVGDQVSIKIKQLDAFIQGEMERCGVVLGED